MSIGKILPRIFAKVRKNLDLEEEEVKNIFVDEGFFSTLGYEGFGVDIRAEKYIVGKNRPDYFCKDMYGNVVFVIEFKSPGLGTDLAHHKDQLWDQYVKPLKAGYGLLTDGVELIFYKRETRGRAKRLFRQSLDILSDDDLLLMEKLRKPSFDFTSKETVREYLTELEVIPVDTEVDQVYVGQNEFLDTFRIEKGTILSHVLEKAYNLLTYNIEHGEAFTKDAFEFWREYYAPDSKDVKWANLPKVWKEIAGDHKNSHKIIFAVETVQSLLGRFMLAKACEDYDFPGIEVSRFVAENIRDFRDRIPLVTYIQTARNLMNRMRSELVESVFEEDIYHWWTFHSDELDTLTVSEIMKKRWPVELTEFGRSIIDLLVSVVRFDFSSLRGDLLGELYQRYFTPEIRKALGEFYTPPVIAEYILDSIQYESNVHNKRIIDPSCGSGTFLVEALRRYKNDLQGQSVNWAVALKDLCEQSRIVGLDVHPFAVLMAQIRFLIEILPQYKEAVSEEGLVLKRLPIYRTDSLVDETKIDEGSLIVDEAGNVQNKHRFTMPLPIRKGSTFESMEFELPRFGYVQVKTKKQIQNRQQYFASLLAVFDAVKEFGGKKKIYSISAEQLEGFFLDYFSEEIDISVVSEVFLETANSFLETVRRLHNEYHDGRLLKLVEDVVLSSVLKNSIKYDFVVGNPPWVSKHSRYSGVERDKKWKQLYITAWKESDMYMLFMERGLQMLKNPGGRLGYIVSNRFLYNEGAGEIRALLAKNRILELVDFTDYQLFQDATNYSAIVTVQKTTDDEDWEGFVEGGRIRDQYKIKTTRVRGWQGNLGTLVKQMRSRRSTDLVDFFTIDSKHFQERIEIRTGRVVREEVFKVFPENGRRIKIGKRLPQADFWPVASPQEFKILCTIEKAMNLRLGDCRVVRGNKVEEIDSYVGNSIHVGVQTNGDGVYVVKAEPRIDRHELIQMDSLFVRPRSIDKKYKLETALLKADITGKSVDRWLPNWDGRLVIVPYVQEGKKANLIRPAVLKEQYPHTWKFFTDQDVLRTLSHESGARRRIHEKVAILLGIIKDGERISDKQYVEMSKKLRRNAKLLDRQKQDLWWYRYVFRKNIEVLSMPKTMTGNQAQRNRLCFDSDGSMAHHNARVFAILLDEKTKLEIAGILNSAVVEFYHKVHARIHKGKAYSYIKTYISKWPLVLPEPEVRTKIRRNVKEILKRREVEKQIEDFPEAYILKNRHEGAEFVSLSYKPPRDLVGRPKIQATLDGAFFIEMDKKGSIISGIETEPKAEYVKQALLGRSLKRNKTVSISVPLSDNVAQSAVAELEKDKSWLEKRPVRKIEEEIDELVFQMYGITSKKDKEVIYRYINQHRELKALIIQKSK